jgi:hypothetical protein
MYARPSADSDAADEWLSAPEAYRRIVNATWSSTTNLALAQRALSGLLRAKALMLTIDGTDRPDAEIPKRFWWAGGHEALTQDWKTGDFETWIDRKVHMRALGVHFHLGDLKNAFPEVFRGDPKVTDSPDSSIGKGGRPPAEWWDDLWIAISCALYMGDLKPKRQADIEKAMNDWIASKGESAAVSTVRNRARKLWQALSREDGN